MTVAKATVTGPLLDASGAPAVGVAVVARLVSVASGGHTADGELVQPVEATTDDSGQFSLSLPLNTAIQPAGTFYRINAGRTVWSIVLTSAGTFHVGDIALAVLSPEPPGWVPVESSGGHSSGTGVQKGDGSGGFAAAVAGTDFDAAGAAAGVAAALGTAATHPASDFDAAGAAAAVQALAALRANNLSDLANSTTARTNLGLGTAATQPTSAFDVAGAATAAIAASAQRASNLSDLANAATARTNLGLGTAATQASTAFDSAGAAAAAQAASQPLDTELTALAGLTSAADRAPYFTGSGAAALAILTAFARTLLDDADATTMRATLGLGTAATQATGVFAQTANNLSDVTAATARNNLAAAQRLAATPVKTGNYTAAIGDLVLCDATAGGFAVTLPTTPVVGAKVNVKKLDATTNAVTVTCGGSDLIITGASTTSATANLAVAEAREFVFDGTSRWIVAVGQTPLGTLDARYAGIASPTFTGEATAPDFAASGLTGATAGARFVGATTSGPPVSGTFAVGDSVTDKTGVMWVCTASGTPGTWVLPGHFTSLRCLPGAVGQWYANPLMIGVANFATGVNNLNLHAVNSGPSGVTISQLDIYVNSAYAAGGVVSMGIYKIANQALPFLWDTSSVWATILLDAGTVPTTGTGRIIKSLGTPLVIAPNLWFAVGGVEQVSASGNRSVATTSRVGGYPFGVGNPSASYLGQGGFSLLMPGVSGSLPANFTPSGTNNIDDGVGFYRSA